MRLPLPAMTRRRATYIAFAACCAALAVAQDTTVRCNYADWTTNGRGQSPCLVWAELQTKCDSGGVRVTPLTSSRYHYTEPDEPREINDCNCSVVAYNLMAACTWCQLGVTDKWVNETVWRSQCPSYNARGLSIDTSGLTIPSWATIPVDGGMWRPNIASLAASPPTVSPTSGSPTTEFSPQSTADTGTHHAEGHGSNAGAIAGGVVGAALIIMLFAALFIFFIRRSKRRAEIEARLRASRRDRTSRNSSRPRSTAGTGGAGAGTGGEKRHSRSTPTTEKPQTQSPTMPTAPEMAYHPRCNHGIASLAGASPRASTSTAAPTATEDGGRTPPKSADHMV